MVEDLIKHLTEHLTLLSSNLVPFYNSARTIKILNVVLHRFR